MGVALDELIACPKCDAVFQIAEPEPGQRAVCSRCHGVLIAPRKRAGKALIANALAIIILLCAATVLPFLSVGAGGVHHDSSVLDAALAFSGPLLLVSLLVAGFIVIVPMVRMLLLIYVLVPVSFDRPPAAHARGAFRLSERLAPWSMAEIFAIGCAVALVKLGGYAEVQLGPAFYLFSVLVVLLVAQDLLMCRYSVWKSLET